MLAHYIIAFLAMVPGQAEFRTNEVSITTNIQSNVYTYKVTNQSSSPIVRFEIKQHASYNFLVPEGWEHEVSSDVLAAWTDDTKAGIQPNKTSEFSLRVSSIGAVLGQTPVKIKFLSGKTITIPNVWAPTTEPRSYIALIAGLILFIMVLHISILAYKKRQVKKIINGV